MRIQPKLTASAIGLFVLLTTAVDGVLDVGTDDMHWPTASVAATIGVLDSTDDMHWPTRSAATIGDLDSTDDMHWPTRPAATIGETGTDGLLG
jgi:hypothetical protein